MLGLGCIFSPVSEVLLLWDRHCFEDFSTSQNWHYSSETTRQGNQCGKLRRCRCQRVHCWLGVCGLKDSEERVSLRIASGKPSVPMSRRRVPGERNSICEVKSRECWRNLHRFWHLTFTLQSRVIPVSNGKVASLGLCQAPKSKNDLKCFSFCLCTANSAPIHTYVVFANNTHFTSLSPLRGTKGGFHGEVPG